MSNIDQTYKDLVKDNTLICTEKEKQEFLEYGILLESNGKYYDRDFNLINIDIVGEKNYNMDIDLSSIIDKSLELSITEKQHRIFCMTSDLYNIYNNSGKIVNKNGLEYYREFNIDWLILKI